MIRSIGVLFSVVLLAAVAAVGQITTGGVEGRIVDTTGAVISGATVRVRNSATEAVYQSSTNARGQYRIERLEPGNYEIETSAPGFQTQRWAVRVKLGETQNVTVELAVGRAEENIDVADYGAAVDTQNVAVHEVVTPEDLHELPTQQRSFSDLLTLVPGIRPQGAFARNKVRVGTISINGSDGRNSEVSLDGMDNRDYIVGGYLQALPLLTVQEYQVTTASALPEAGRSNGAVIDVVSRTGTAATHGELFFQARDDAFSSRNYFQRLDDAPKAASSRQQFGGALGGRLRKDVYYFAGTEFLRDRGNSYVTDTAFNELKYVPGTNPQQFIPQPYDDQSASGRLDWARNDFDRVFFRFSAQHNRGKNELIGEPAASDISNGNTTSNRYFSTALSWMRNISQNTLNEFALGAMDSRSEVLPVTDVPNLSFASTSVPGLPDTPAVQVGANQNTPAIYFQTRYQLRDDITLSRGRHNLKLGVSEMYQPRTGGLFLFGSMGYTIFFFDRPSVIATDTTLYPQGFATPGAVRELTYSTGDGSFKHATNLVSGYINDAIRFTPRFTMNLGLRYDYGTGFYPDMSRDPAFVLLSKINSPLAAHQPETPANMLQPRIGVAWNPDGQGKSVLRAGYGIFFESFIQQFAFPSLQRQNETQFSTPIDLVNTRTGDIGPADAGDFSGFRFGVDPLPFAAPDTDLAAGSTVRYLDPNFQNAYSQQWTAGYERKIGDKWVAGADYIHILGLHEQMTVEANPKPVGGGPRRMSAAFDAAGVTNPLGSVRLFQSNGRSRYDAMTLSVRRSLDKHLAMQASYVLSRSVTWGGRYSTSYNFGRARVSDTDVFAPGEFGPSSADERHRFVTSAIVRLPWDLELAPVVQAASARPYTAYSGQDLNGDGVYGGSGEEGIFGDRLIVNGVQLPVNSMRGDPFFQADLRVSKGIRLGERVQARLFGDFFNLFNTDNFGNNYFNVGLEAHQNPRPRGVFGKQGEVGSAVGLPFAAQFGVRVTF